MPNLLAHFGAQGLVSQAARWSVAPRWILLGCLLPDLPWIMQRVVQALGPAAEVDGYTLRLYAVSQASLVVTLALCGAIALLTSRARAVFAVLAANAVLHLVLDATELKWGTAVHLLAPVTWRTPRVGWFWPEDFTALALTGMGVAYVAWAWNRERHAAASPAVPVSTRRRWVVAVLLATYVTAPVALSGSAFRADVHFVRTLVERSARAGRPIEVDRARYFVRGDTAFIRTFAGEELQLVGRRPAQTSTVVSVRGSFANAQAVAVDALHVHRWWLRDVPTYVALAALLVAWLAAWRRRATPRSA